MCCGRPANSAALTSGAWHGTTGTSPSTVAQPDGPYIFTYPDGTEAEVPTYADADSLARQYGGSIIRKPRAV